MSFMILSLPDRIIYINWLKGKLRGGFKKTCFTLIKYMGPTRIGQLPLSSDKHEFSEDQTGGAIH